MAKSSVLSVQKPDPLTTSVCCSGYFYPPFIKDEVPAFLTGNTQPDLTIVVLTEPDWAADLMDPSIRAGYQYYREAYTLLYADPDRHFL